MTSWGSPTRQWYGKFYPGRKQDSPWNHDLNWKTRCAQEKKELKAREAAAAGESGGGAFGMSGAARMSNEELEAVLSVRSGRASARPEDDFPSASGRGSVAAGSGRLESTRMSATESGRLSASASARSLLAKSGREVATHRTTDSGITTASERAAMEKLRQQYEEEAKKREAALQKVKSLESQLEQIRSTQQLSRTTSSKSQFQAQVGE